MMSIRTCAAILVLATFAGERASAGIILLEDQRYVAITCEGPFRGQSCIGPGPHFAAPLRPFAEFEGSALDISSAHQVSRIGTVEFSGTGWTGTDGGGGPPGETRFQVVFDVNRTTAYSFTGTLSSGSVFDGPPDTPGDRNASLQSGQTDLFRTSDRQFQSQGVLLPDQTYTLSVWNRNGGPPYYTGRWEFLFSTAAVPEPTVGAVSALLLAAVAVRRRMGSSSRRLGASSHVTRAGASIVESRGWGK